MQEFEVKSGKLVITDPCYDLGIWCNATVDAKNGKWVADVEKIKEGFSRNRCAMLMAYHAGTLLENPKLREELRSRFKLNAPLEFVFGVDSGQLGYFDLEIYKNDGSVTTSLEGWDDPDTEPWYGSCCHQTCDTPERWGVINGGVVSSSGWGDGSYATYGIKDNDGVYVALLTVFIDDSDDFDFEDENEDEVTEDFESDETN